MEPIIVERDPQPYVARQESVTMTEFARIADHLPGLIGSLMARGVEITGPPFFRYRVIDMASELVVEAGVPVAGAIEVDDPVFNAVLPPGRYAGVTHVGHPDELMAATARLLDWAQDRGLTWDVAQTPEGEVWGARLELLMTNPAVEPDMHKWETLLLFKLADDETHLADDEIRADG